MATIIGTDGDDFLTEGTPGDDIVYAKGGYDDIYTGTGSDIILVTPGSGIDYVLDWDPPNDTIVFNNFPNLDDLIDLAPYTSPPALGSRHITIPEYGVDVILETPGHYTTAAAIHVNFNRPVLGPLYSDITAEPFEDAVPVDPNLYTPIEIVPSVDYGFHDDLGPEPPR